MKWFKEFIFGVKAKGQPLPPPSFKVTYIEHNLTENEWAQYVKFGSRYGTRGSFYNSKRYEN